MIELRFLIPILLIGTTCLAAGKRSLGCRVGALAEESPAARYIGLLKHGVRRGNLSIETLEDVAAAERPINPVAAPTTETLGFSRGFRAILGERDLDWRAVREHSVLFLRALTGEGESRHRAESATLEDPVRPVVVRKKLHASLTAVRNAAVDRDGRAYFLGWRDPGERERLIVLEGRVAREVKLPRGLHHSALVTDTAGEVRVVGYVRRRPGAASVLEVRTGLGKLLFKAEPARLGISYPREYVIDGKQLSTILSDNDVTHYLYRTSGELKRLRAGNYNFTVKPDRSGFWGYGMREGKLEIFDATTDETLFSTAFQPIDDGAKMFWISSDRGGAPVLVAMGKKRYARFDIATKRRTELTFPQSVEWRGFVRDPNGDPLFIVDGPMRLGGREIRGLASAGSPFQTVRMPPEQGALRLDFVAADGRASILELGEKTSILVDLAGGGITHYPFGLPGMVENVLTLPDGTVLVPVSGEKGVTLIRLSASR